MGTEASTWPGEHCDRALDPVPQAEWQGARAGPALTTPGGPPLPETESGGKVKEVAKQSLLAAG